MKFVCDNCKAKYQIGDDKVAGKTLRMKCRRCGHMIQVAATVTESSVSQKLPTEPAAGSVPAGSSVSGSSGMGPLEGSSEDGATIVRQSPLFLFDHKTADRAAPVPPAPTPSVPGAPPRPGAGTGNIPRPTGIGAPIGGAPRIVPPARPSLRNSNPPAAAPMHSPSSPGLHSGFQAAVAVQPSSPPGAAPLPTEDWYVGVGGVPLGPVRLSIVREKAANGQVDQESLVWREGFDEWLPIKSFPALSALVDEVQQQRNSRTSAPTPSPAAASAFGFTPPVAPVAAPTPSPLAAIPSVPHAAASRNPFAPQAAAAGSLAAAARALAASAPAPSNAGSPAPLGSPRMSTPSVPEAAPSIPFDLTRQSSPPAPAPLAIKDPFGPAHANGATNGSANGSSNGAAHLAPPEAASTGMGYGLTTTAAVTGGSITAAPRLDTVPPSEVAGRKKKGVHPMVWAFVAMAAAFGGVAAWALFLRKPDIVYVPKEGDAVATQPGGAAPPPPPTGVSVGTTGTAEVTASPTESGVAVGGPNKGGGQLPPGMTAKPGEPAAPLDTSGFGPGPGPGPGPDPTSGGGKGALNESQLNGVVSSNSPRVRRKCWDPLVSGRSSNAPNSVKVTATVKIGPSGSVKSVSTSGGNEQYYPGLAGCVQSTVSGWTFPASDEGGTVVVPFGFNAQ